VLSHHLGRLENAGLIRPAAVPADLSYFFRHALIQESAYATLVRQDRQRIHLLVAQTLEQQLTGRLDESAAVLGRHFAEAGDTPRAIAYMTQAADLAARGYANAEAIDLYSRAIELCAGLPPENPASSGQLAHLYGRRGRALELSNRFEEASAGYEELERLASARDDSPLVLEALNLQATLHGTPQMFDARRADDLNQRALHLAQELNDREAEVRVLWNLLLLHTFSGDMEQAQEYGETGLSLARSLGLHERAAFCLHDLAPVYWARGDLDRAEATWAEARDYWRAHGNLPMLCDNLANIAFSAFMRGAYATGLAAADEGYQVSEAAANVWGKCFNLSAKYLILFEQGESAAALENGERIWRLVDASGLAVAFGGSQADLAWMYAYVGGSALAQEIGRRARQGAELPQPSSFRIWAYASLARQATLCADLDSAADYVARCRASVQEQERVRIVPYLVALAEGELALAQGDPGLAVQTARSVLAQIVERGATSFEAEASLILGQGLLALHQTDAARAALRSGLEAAQKLGQNRVMLPLWAALAQAEDAAGDEAAAEAARLAGRRSLEAFLLAMPADYRANFRRMPAAQSVLQSS